MGNRRPIGGEEPEGAAVAIAGVIQPRFPAPNARRRRVVIGDQALRIASIGAGRKLLEKIAEFHLTVPLTIEFNFPCVMCHGTNFLKLWQKKKASIGGNLQFPYRLYGTGRFRIPEPIKEILTSTYPTSVFSRSRASTGNQPVSWLRVSHKVEVIKSAPASNSCARFSSTLLRMPQRPTMI